MRSDPDDPRAVARVGAVLSRFAEKIDAALRPVHAPGAACECALATDGPVELVEN